MSTSVPREKAVFCQAVEITDPEERRQFLDQACGADKALREQVEDYWHFRKAPAISLKSAPPP